MTKRWVRTVIVLVGVWITAGGCSKTGGPASPSSVSSATATAMAPGEETHQHVASQPEDKGYIAGWFEGSDVKLYYTKSYYCAEPPSSGAPSNCELGAPPEEAPRPGRIPTIYAIAAVGFTPPDGTAACRTNSPCLNHPTMIDLSRVGGPASAPAVSHSHILSAHGGGWFNTVNIRVFSIEAWKQIAYAKSLAKVRELQGNNPQVGTPGVISADTPTNIYFFIASFRPN